MVRQKFEHLVKQLNQSDLNQKFPSLRQNKNKTNVLFIQCLSNAKGMMRTFLPFQVLNATGTHSALIANCHSYDFSKSLKDYDNPTDKRLIEWADIIVFPASLHDLTPSLLSLLDINDKLGFVMDINKNYLQEVKQERGNVGEDQILMNNISEMDVVTFPNSYLRTIFLNQYHKSSFNRTPYFEVIPSLITPDWNTKKSIQNTQEVIRVGLFEMDFTNSFKSGLQRVLENLPHELHILASKKKNNPFPSLNVKVHKFRKYLDYLDLLGQLHLDVALLEYPLERVGKDLHLFAEFTMQGIPIVTNSNAPFAHIISHRDNGYLLHKEDSWEKLLTETLHNRIHLRNVGHYARRFTLKHLCWNHKKAKMLADLFH